MYIRKFFLQCWKELLIDTSGKRCKTCTLPDQLLRPLFSSQSPLLSLQATCRFVTLVNRVKASAFVTWLHPSMSWMVRATAAEVWNIRLHEFCDTRLNNCYGCMFESNASQEMLHFVWSFRKQVMSFGIWQSNSFHVKLPQMTVHSLTMTCPPWGAAAAAVKACLMWLASTGKVLWRVMRWTQEHRHPTACVKQTDLIQMSSDTVHLSPPGLWPVQKEQLS